MYKCIIQINKLFNLFDLDHTICLHTLQKMDSLYLHLLSLEVLLGAFLSVINTLLTNKGVAVFPLIWCHRIRLSRYLGQV